MAAGSSDATTSMPPTSSQPPVPPAWGRASGRVVQHLDEDDLPEHLVAALRTLVPFEFAICFVYRRRGGPVHFYDTLSDPRARQGLMNYLDDTYVLNPVYNAYRHGLEDGVYRIGELAPDAWFVSGHGRDLKAHASNREEIGYLTEDWPPGREEVVLIAGLEDGEMGEISLSRPVASGGFDSAHLLALQAVQPFVAAVFARHWRRVRPTAPAADSSASEQAFDRLGGRLLSPRERQVAQLILRGHSTASVGLKLGISPTTVKTHRKHLYEKLGIGSQYELFTLFLSSLDRPPA